MNLQEEALASISLELERRGVPYMIIGGLANAIWGEPRATLDVDVTVWVPKDRLSAVITDLCASFRGLVDRPENFVAETRVLPLESKDGVRIDVIFGVLPFEQEAIGRASKVRVGRQSIPFCTPEDLILMKIFSTRPRDIDDARGVTLRRFHDLDLDYLEPRVQELASLLHRPEIRARWKQWKQQATRKRADEKAKGGKLTRRHKPK